MSSLLQATLALALLSEPQAGPRYPVIPNPLELVEAPGHFALQGDAVTIRASAALDREAQLLAGALTKFAGVRAAVVVNGAAEAGTREIVLALADSERALPRESYELTVTPEAITILGADAAGVFYGAQTLVQLVDADKKVPACTIRDQPRFRWRGVHLDVGRHLFAADDIKGFLDWLALHKLNTFHWHLSEDQGWRVEIKKYPKLTEVGAYRASTPPYGDRGGSDGARYGGFYTQEQIRDIVAYATQRHITVVPEIDMPGHMAAAIASYPELGNSDIPDYAPRVMTSWGVHPYVLAPREETFAWIDDVLEELCELFPSRYIHIGGDEAPKEQWRQSPFAQSVIKREGLEGERGLQSYFIGRVEALLEAKGRKLIGWDEIREGGLSPSATVMVWRGWEHAVASAREGHDVVMAPTSHTYLDHYQYDPEAILSQGVEYEAIGGHRTIESVYGLEPVPPELVGTPHEARILGCQAQLWSEYLHSWDKVEYRAFPRIAALAEVAWTARERKDMADFMARLRSMVTRYQKAGVNTFDPFHPPGRGDGAVERPVEEVSKTPPAPAGAREKPAPTDTSKQRGCACGLEQRPRGGGGWWWLAPLLPLARRRSARAAGG